MVYSRTNALLHRPVAARHRQPMDLASGKTGFRILLTTGY
jgi:hypothetical protein